jgi:hypothetical protein
MSGAFRGKPIERELTGANERPELAALHPSPKTALLDIRAHGGWQKKFPLGVANDRLVSPQQRQVTDEAR